MQKYINGYLNPEAFPELVKAKKGERVSNIEAFMAFQIPIETREKPESISSVPRDPLSFGKRKPTRRERRNKNK
jgi:hypothetical protein